MSPPEYLPAAAQFAPHPPPQSGYPEGEARRCAPSRRGSEPCPPKRQPAPSGSQKEQRNNRLYAPYESAPPVEVQRWYTEIVEDAEQPCKTIVAERQGISTAGAGSASLLACRPPPPNPAFEAKQRKSVTARGVGCY